MHHATYNSYIQTVFLLLFHCIAIGNSCPACIELGSLTFQRIVNHFPLVLVKFDIAYPYGDEHEAYSNFAQDCSTTPHTTFDDLLVATVGIKDYGHRVNSDLARRFNAPSMDDLPVIHYRKSLNDPWFQFPKHLKITGDALLNFVAFHSPNVRIALNGTDVNLNAIVAEFVETYPKTGELAIEKVQGYLKTVNATQEDPRNGYAALMRRINNRKTMAIVDEERRRVAGLLSLTKLSNTKRLALRQRLNIIDVFAYSLKSSNRSYAAVQDEL